MIDEPIERQGLIKKYSDEETKKLFNNLGQKSDEIMVKALDGAKEEEKINHPAHYNLSEAKCKSCGHQIECIDVVGAFGFHLGNVIKYAWRAEHKGGIEDLKKAQFYLNDYIKREDERGE